MKPAKRHLSTRIPGPLDDFLREKAETFPGGLTALVEDYLTRAALTEGYQPPVPVIPEGMQKIANLVADIVLQRLLDRGLIGPKD